MKPGDHVVNGCGWRATVVQRRNAKGNTLIRWLSGPIKGHEARVAARTLKPAPKRKIKVIRKGKKVTL